MSFRPPIPFLKALRYIALSVLVVTTLSFTVLGYIGHIKHKQEKVSKYNIVAIVQKNSEVESLKTAYLSEILDLSTDRPTNLYRFDIRKNENKLKRNPLIKEAKIQKIFPATIFVDYTLRLPVAYLADFSNTAIDEEGVLIPFKPFFTPKKLPEIVLGLQTDGGGLWGKKLTGEKGELAMEIFKLLRMHFLGDYFALLKIDVSKAYASSYGQRTILVKLETKREENGVLNISSHLLRLSTNNFKQELANYKAMTPFFETQTKKGETLIDLRVPHLAYVY